LTHLDLSSPETTRFPRQWPDELVKPALGCKLALMLRSTGSWQSLERLLAAYRWINVHVAAPPLSCFQSFHEIKTDIPKKFLNAT